MLRSTATVLTPRADRYRDQLASHGAGMVRLLHQRDHPGGPPIHDATVSEDCVVLDLAWGRCTITATDAALVLRAEARTRDDLARIQTGVGQRVTTMGRREGLAVAWSPIEGEAASDGAGVAEAEHRRRLLAATPIVAIVGGAIAVHLGIGASLMHQHWAWPVLATVGVLALLKVAVARHVSVTRPSHRSRRA